MDILLPQRLLLRDLSTSESFDCYDAFGHGLFQRRLLLLCTIAFFLFNVHDFAYRLILKDVEYWCKLPAPPPQSNISVVEWRGLFLPEEPDGKLSRCRRYEYPKEPNGTTPETIVCDEWEYGDDDEPARTSAVSDWNLVCQRDTLIILMVVVHCFGSCLFSGVAGCLADSVGRMPVLLAGVVVLIISTVIGCLSRSFHTFVVAKFFSSGGVSAVMITTITSVFEVTTHSDRPLQIIFAGMLAVLFSDIWEATVAQVKIWTLRYAVFMLPTVLMVPAFCFASESPRSLIARGRIRHAEAVMMDAAAVNHFPMHCTALTVDKLKAEFIRNEIRLPSIDQEMLNGYSMRRWALILSLSYFSITFATFVSAFSLMRRKESWFDHVSFTMNILCYVVMDWLISRFSMVTVLNMWFMILGVLQCLLGLAFGIGGEDVCPILIMVTTALYYCGSILCLVYVQEIFPTAVRGSTVGLVFACGRLGCLSAIAGRALQRAGRRDIGHAVAAILLLVLIYAHDVLPHATNVERAKMKRCRVPSMSKRTTNLVKRTPDSSMHDTREGRASAESPRSTISSRSHPSSRH
ncbi:solute carrier family 22 member 7 [Rhipicephalus microplus]|uniref:solute carrier family 22 member 7 n=1 Tax=Rhipicephalus microplus TaxID=6941 RepID=UPI003F6CCB5A